MLPDKKYKLLNLIFNNVIRNYYNNKDKKDNIGINSIKKWNNFNSLIINKIKSKRKSSINKLKF